MKQEVYRMLEQQNKPQNRLPHAVAMTSQSHVKPGNRGQLSLEMASRDLYLSKLRALSKPALTLLLISLFGPFSSKPLTPLILEHQLIS